MVNADQLIEVATAVRDEMGYDYLSSVTAVDYLPEGKIEVVYHAYKSTGGPALAFKVQTPRDNPVVPSLFPVYPGVELQEREEYDLLGVRFEGHPDLRRILMWEGFDGYPLRKDWREPYYEEEGKPFKSRWPDGHVYRIEDKNPFDNNIDYPAGFNPKPGRRITMACYASLSAPSADPTATRKTDTG
jgi:NADH-quinone oxidoreductase subunit D/NADH-quinone oxidoreductase subunit C/D